MMIKTRKDFLLPNELVLESELNYADILTSDHDHIACNMVMIRS
jgi:hypothetical protein